ncbi:hypothetical protein Sru01_68840 [Sphaerisporangium rufum]|uniref:Uncharacterized protein n=1 Tax=Sphaerisporangium rufum TaxID=1381558 RepID=A0A919R923_9ACTN|nr:hypothetical protein Sru01_68840 [Sphaerisporangium rufum]
MLIVGGVALLAVVLVAAVAVFADFGSTGDPAPPAARRSTPTGQATPDLPAQLASAAGDLAALPGVRYQGRLAGVAVDTRVLRRGSAYGTLRDADTRLEVLAIREKTFLKGDRAFWTDQGASAATAKENARKWSKVPADRLPGDGFAMMTPARMAEWVRGAGSTPDGPPGAPREVNGVPARPVTLSGGNVYLTVAPPYRVVRVEFFADPAGGGEDDGPGGDRGRTDEPDSPRPTVTSVAYPAEIRPAAASAAAPAIMGRLDLTGLEPAAAKTFAGGLRPKVQALRTSIDSQVSLKVVGKGTLSPCNHSGCTANARLQGRPTGGDPDYDASAKIAVDVAITFRLDGSPVGTCRRTITMRADGVGKVSCGVTYSANRAANHRIGARITALARGVGAAELARMLATLDSEG